MLEEKGRKRCWRRRGGIPGGRQLSPGELGLACNLLVQCKICARRCSFPCIPSLGFLGARPSLPGRLLRGQGRSQQCLATARRRHRHCCWGEKAQPISSRSPEGFHALEEGFFLLGEAARAVRGGFKIWGCPKSKDFTPGTSLAIKDLGSGGVPFGLVCLEREQNSPVAAGLCSAGCTCRP